MAATRLSPDKRRLYLARCDAPNYRYSIQCLDLATGQEPWQTEPQRGWGLTTLAVSPDGRVLAVAIRQGNDHEIGFYDLGYPDRRSGLAHSKTWRSYQRPRWSRSISDCSSPLALFPRRFHRFSPLHKNIPKRMA